MAKRKTPIFHTIPDIWKYRFHRKRETTDWIFYLSRPGLEFLRKPDEDSKAGYEFLRNEIKNFLNGTEKKTGNIVFKTIIGKDLIYATFMYPFNIQQEASGRTGCIIHVGKTSSKSAVTGKNESPVASSSMFSPEINEWVKKSLPTPPEIDDVDPMWNEFSGAKFLPTDELLKPEGKWRDFRHLLCHQFIEIRLTRHALDGKASSGEQIDALNQFQSTSSGFAHFGGAPGTGKSTLLHMVCAHRLALNKGLEGDLKKDIFYYTPSFLLKEEGQREIKTILEYIYLATQQELTELMHNIKFVSQEELYLADEPGREWNLLGDTGSQIRLMDLFGKKKGDVRGTTEINLFKQQVRQLVIGVFESKNNFLNFAKKQSKQNWNKQELNLFNPNQPSPSGIQLQSFLKSDDLDNFNRKLREIDLFEGIHPESYWDPTLMILNAKYQRHPDGNIWNELKGKMNYIVMDEAQDINISEIRTILTHFSSRQEENYFDDFHFIGAGDENQNIKQLMFFSQNHHLKHLFIDWARSLKIKASKDKILLSHGLDEIQNTILKSAYRIFDEMIGPIQEILKQIHDISEDKKPPSGFQKTLFGRKGVFSINNSNDRSHGAGEWNDMILEKLADQLEDKKEELSNNIAPLVVALCFDEDDLNPDNFNVDTNPLFDRLMGVPNSNELHARVNELLTRFTNKFIEKKRGDAEPTYQDWLSELSFRGVLSVKDIKGLTVPITTIIPPALLLDQKKNHRINQEKFSKFLVQLTRAQYYNLLLDNVQELGMHEYLVTEIEQEDVKPWLSNILQHSLGFDPSFELLFKQTLQNYDSEIYWKKLTLKVDDMDEDIKQYVLFMKEFYISLQNNKLAPNLNDFFTLQRENSANPDIIEISNIKLQNESNTTMEIDGLKEIDEKYLLGTRMDKKYLASVMLFIVINHYIRKKLHPETIDGDENLTLPNELLGYMKNWVQENQDSTIAENNETTQWFNLISGEYSDTNPVYQSLRESFIPRLSEEGTYRCGMSEEWQWPSMKSPRLDMGYWRFTQPSEESFDSVTGKEYDLADAWMSEQSNFFRVPKHILTEAAIKSGPRHDDTRVPHWLKMQHGMATFKPKIFVSGLIKLINSHQNDTRHNYIRTTTKNRDGNDIFRFPVLDWYIDVIHHKDNTEQMRRFHKDCCLILQEELTGEVKNEPLIKLFSDYLASVETIAQLSNIISAFDFSKWSFAGERTIMDVFERTLGLMENYISEVVKIDNAVKEINILKNNIDKNKKDIDELKQAIGRENSRLEDDKTRTTKSRERLEQQLYGLELGTEKSETEKNSLEANTNLLKRHHNLLYDEALQESLRTNPFAPRPNQSSTKVVDVEHISHRAGLYEFFNREFENAMREVSDGHAMQLYYRTFVSMANLNQILLSGNITQHLIKLEIDVAPFTQGKNQQYLNEFYKHYVNIDENTIIQIRKELIDLFKHNHYDDTSSEKTPQEAWSRFLTSIHNLGDIKGGLKENLLKPIRKENSEFLSVLLQRAFRDDPDINSWSWNLLYYLINPSSFQNISDFDSINSSWSEIQKIDVISENIYPDHTMNDFQRLTYLPHTIIASGLPKFVERPLHNLSAARALSFLNRNEYAKAIDSFNASGHLKYSGTLRLAQTYINENENDDFRREMLMEIISILKNEMQILEEIIYGLGTLKEEIKQLNRTANYGIGVEKFKLPLTNKTTSLMNMMFPNFKFSASGKSFESGKPILLTEKKHFTVLNYFEHYERVKNLTLYSEFLEEVINEKSGKDMSKYLEEIKKCDLSKYRLFRDSKHKGTKYKLNWNEANGGMTIDEETYEDEGIKQLHSFVIKCLDQDGKIAQCDFKNALLELTNLHGHVKEKIAEMLGDDAATRHRVDTESEYFERLGTIFKHQKYIDAGKPYVQYLLPVVIDIANGKSNEKQAISDIIKEIDDDDKKEVHKILSELKRRRGS